MKPWQTFKIKPRREGSFMGPDGFWYTSSEGWFFLRGYKLSQIPASDFHIQKHRYGYNEPCPVCRNLMKWVTPGAWFMGCDHCFYEVEYVNAITRISWR